MNRDKRKLSVYLLVQEERKRREKETVYWQEGSEDQRKSSDFSSFLSREKINKLTVLKVRGWDPKQIKSNDNINKKGRQNPKTQ